jgi:hypothetical protein
MYIRNFLFFVGACGLFAQERPFSFGFTTGVPITDGLQGSPDISKRYTLGALGEYRFTDHISLFVNPLYRRTGRDSEYTYIPGIGDSNVPVQTLITDRSHNLDIPVLGRYTFFLPSRKLRPFVSLGFSLNTSWREVKSLQTTQNPTTGEIRADRFSFQRQTDAYTAATVGAGVDLRLRPFHLLPEFRYSYHGKSNPSGRNDNQVDFLLSFRF